MKKKVALIFPRFKYPSGDISLGLACLGSYIREKIKDINLSLLDTTFSPSWEKAEKFLKKEKPDIVGIYTGTIMFNDCVKVAKIAKKYGATVIAGGPHPTIMPDSVFKEKYFDAVCIGEGEETFEEYINTFYGNKEFENVKGIWFRKGKKVIKNQLREPITNLDSLPIPAYDLFDMKKYKENFLQLDTYDTNLKGISVVVSRGCPFNCSFCQPTLRKIFGKVFRMRSPEKVIEELKYLKDNYKINAFFFTDDTFTANKKWVHKFCSLMKKEKLGLLWGCNTRANTIDFEMMKLMKSAGLVKLKAGIESIVERIRNGIYNKGITEKQIKDLLKNAKKLKIQAAGYFMLGAPTETAGEVWKTINFAANSSLIEANFSIATPLPETGLYNYVLGKGWTLPTDFGSYDYYQVKRPQMSKEEVSIENLVLLKKLANIYFYLHPNRIMITLKSMWGFSGLRKLIQKLRRL